MAREREREIVKVRVRCVDGVERGGPFDSVREATKWANWEHVCTSYHDYVVERERV